MKRFPPPLVTLSDEEPIAAGGWWIFAVTHSGDWIREQARAGARLRPLRPGTN